MNSGIKLIKKDWLKKVNFEIQLRNVGGLMEIEISVLYIKGRRWGRQKAKSTLLRQKSNNDT